MRMRNPKDKDLLIETCDYFYSEENSFANNNPIHLEIGMGKGKFILEMALNNPSGLRGGTEQIKIVVD